MYDFSDVFIEKYKPVRHEKRFLEMYDQAFIELEDEIPQFNNAKKQSSESLKKDCMFDKTIFIYKKGDNIAGFCMYQKIADYSGHFFMVLLDFVDKKYRGIGRKCRIALGKEFCKTARKVVLSINKNNLNSLNSFKKVASNYGNGYAEYEEVNDSTLLITCFFT